MRKLLLRVAFVGFLAALTFSASTPVPVGAASAPASVRAWLGDWSTNQGTVVFDSIGTCSFAPVSATQTRYPGCVVSGRWKQLGHGWVAIHGFVYLGTRTPGEVLEGCYQLAQPPPGSTDHCGAVRIDRNANNLVGGYWKACGADVFITPNCDPHHPWLGHKVKSTPQCSRPPGIAYDAAASGPTCHDYTVNFNFTVDGFPDHPSASELPSELVGVKIQSHQTQLVWDSSADDWSAKGHIVMVTTYLSAGSPHFRDRFVVVNLIEGQRDTRYVSSSTQRGVRVYGDVSKSTDPACRKGTALSISFAVGTKAADLYMYAGCLAHASVAWSTDRFKHARISKPV